MTVPPLRPGDEADLSVLSALAPQLAQTFVSVASDIALVIDGNGVIRNVAVGAEPLTASTDQWVGRPWADTVSSDTRRKVEQLLSEVHATGVTRRREVNHPVAGGVDVPVAYAAIRLGEHGPVLAVGRDLRAVAAIQQRFIDAQQEMERDYWKQRHAESRYRMLFQVATDAVMVVEAQTLKIIEANQAAESLLGAGSHGLVGLTATAGIEPASRPGVEELLLTARTSGRPAEIRARLARASIDASRLAAGGASIDISATPFRSDDGMLLLVRARAASPVAMSSEADERLAEFVAQTPDIVVITDSSGRVLMANPAFVTLCHGVAETQVLGRNLADTVGDPQRQLSAIVAEARRHGIASHRRALVGSDMASPQEVEVSAALLAEGDQECIGLTMRQVQTQADLAARAVGELAAAIDRLGVQMGETALPDLLLQASTLAERHLISAAVMRAQGDTGRAAELLGVSRQSLIARMRGLDLRANDDRGNGSTPSSTLLN